MYGIQGTYIIAGQYYMKNRAILNIGQYNTVLYTVVCNFINIMRTTFFIYALILNKQLNRNFLINSFSSL